jgi:hypothetical protein
MFNVETFARILQYQYSAITTERHTTLVTWIPGVENNGRVRDGESVVLDVHLMGSGQLWVVEDLVDTSGQVPDTVLHLHVNRDQQCKKCFLCLITTVRTYQESITIQLLPKYCRRLTLVCIVAEDPVFYLPLIRYGKISGSEIQDEHISKRLVKIFLIINSLNSLMGIRIQVFLTLDPGWKKFRSATLLKSYQVMGKNFFKSFPNPTNLPSHTSLPILFVPSFSSQFLLPIPSSTFQCWASRGDPDLNPLL